MGHHDSHRCVERYAFLYCPRLAAKNILLAVMESGKATGKDEDWYFKPCPACCCEEVVPAGVLRHHVNMFNVALFFLGMDFVGALERGPQGAGALCSVWQRLYAEDAGIQSCEDNLRHACLPRSPRSGDVVNGSIEQR